MINLLQILKVTLAENASDNGDGSVTLHYSDGTKRFATSSEIFEAKRSDLSELVNIERANRESQGLVYTFPDGFVGTIQTRNSIDFRNIAGLTAAATIAVLQGNTTPLWFTDAENIRHSLTPLEVIALGVAVQQHISLLYSIASTIKEELKTSDPDTFDITLNWPE